MQAAYSAASRETKLAWHTVGDALLVRYFGWATGRPAQGGLQCALPPPVPDSRGLVWAPNDYPYNLAPGIEHHLAWSCCGPPSSDVLEAFVAAQRPPAAYHSIVFINPRHLQSVRNVWHAHVLSLRRAPRDS